MQVSPFVIYCIINSFTILVCCQTYTECGGKLVGPGGTISSPNFPSSYPNNAKCNWTIMAGVNEIINLEFKIVDFDGYMDACPDYAVIYDGDSIRSPVIQQLCRYKNSTELTSLFVRSTSNKVYVTFTSDAFNQRQGFLANYWTHACQPMTYGPQRCTQNCSCLAENTVFCNNFNGSCTCKKGWTSPTCGADIDECAPPLNEACPRDYQICKNKPGSFECECQAGLVRNETTGACQADTNASCTSACPGLCGKVTLQGQVTPTEQCYCPYNTKLDGSQCQACTNLTYGRNCERSCSTCDKNNTQRCDNVTGQCICLPGWSGSTCADDVDECRFSGNLRVCRETAGNYHCVNTIGSYRCDCNQGYEKVANGTCTPIVCNFTLNASTGNITSPYYPENYYSLIPCTWTITVATGKSINLRFSQFYAQDFYSFVHIFDGHNADSFLLFRFHSSVVNKVIRTTGNTMHIKFNSTIKIYGRFNGTYTTNDFASGCKQSINATDERQILKNPGYPTYINNTVCYWAIHAPVGYNVSLRFTDFLLDTQGKSFLQVYNPRNAVLGIYGLFYGVPIPKAITSADNTLYVLFQSDGSIAGRGFNATFLRCLPFYYGEEKCTTPCSCVKNNTQYCDSFNGMCTCYPGWQSATCADDVDECLSNPCYLTEKCVNTLGSFRCIPDCDSNLTSVSGSISTIGYPNYHLRRALCKWRIQGSAGQVVTLSIKSQDFQLVEERQCSWDSLNIFSVGNTTSTQIGRYCGTRVPPLIRTSCNIMEIQLKTEADEYWSRRGFTGVYYTHSCNDFTYGPTCQFTCTCNLSKTQFCDNTNGVCVCKPGWTGDTCSEDVNECNYNTCPTNEVCKNTPGNYSCECRLGFSRTETGQCEGNSQNCVTAKNKTCSHFCDRNTAGVLICTCPENMEIRAVENQCVVTLYPYGADKGDLGLIKTKGNSQYVSKPIVFATKVPVGAGTETEAYVFSDGVIRFGGNVISGTYDLAVQNGFKIIAPYWATLNPTKGEVFYHLYESCEPSIFSESATVRSSPAKAKVMERAAQDVRNTYRFYDFKVKTVLVATWKNVQILSSVIKTNPPTGTFQAVYISGYRKESIGDPDFIDEETAYVYFIYPKGGMNLIALKNSGTSIGISAGPYANKIQLSQTTFDWIKNKNYYKEVITFEIGRISGPEQKCEKHVCKNSQLITNADYRNQISQLYTCPCTLGLLGLQWSLYEKRGALKDIFCFVISPVAKRRILQNNPRNKLCCYKWTQPSVTSDWMKWAESRQQASFIHNTPDAGHVLVGDPWWSLAANESLEAQRSCCKDGNVGKLCDRYNLLYPDQECSYDVTFVPAWMLGDPTIVTLDNVTYLFNGRGEYIMMDVQSENFTLQARTDRAETSNGTLTNATVFTAFAAKEKEISHFQVELAASKTSMFLYVRGQNITESFYSFVDYRLSLETIEVFRDDSGNKTKVAVVFPCGVSFTFRVGYKSLELDMQAQKTLKGKTKGLLGNFNGNKKDEFTLPNGTVLRSNLTEREIFFLFANKYQVTQANSVFTYRDGKTALDYQFPDFVPFFNDSATASQLQKAREVCKNGTDSCVFDYMVTNDLNFAINTNNTISQSLTVKKILANSCPVLSVVRNKNYVNRRWLVQEGVANTLSFKAVDKDKDAVTYILVEGSSAVSLTQNGLLTYTPSVNSTVSVVLRVKDSQDCYSPVMIIPITICPRCSGHGQCNKNMTRETEYFGSLVKIFKCSCLPGYTGANCESELDACKDNPCYKGQTCTDLTAAQQGNSEIGYICGPCPAGYTNYLGKCIDVDECKNPSRCENYCNNTDGGYECSCREGFVLNRTDAKTCLAKNCSNRCVTQNTLYCDEGVSQCVCMDGIKTPDCSVNVDKCLSKPCPANLMCVSTQTSYECLCLNGQRPINGGCADCNRQLTEVSGKFMSSNYPDNYPSNQFCTWTIMSNDSLAIISLNITEFVVEGCPYDYLEVYDGRDTNADLFGQYCTDAPGLVTSSGNSLTVTFTSDGSGNLKGFIASYAIESQCKNLQCSHSCQIVSVNPRVEKCVCPEWTRLDTVSGTKCLEINACNTTVTSSSGLIVSPGYPQKYGAYTTCYWTIPAKTNTFTKLSFLDIDMEAGSTCPYDSIKVYDGTSYSAPLLSLVCEGVLPQAITSTGKGVFIVFKSDESIAGRGFKLQYG